MNTKERLSQIKKIDKLIELKYAELGKLKDTEATLGNFPHNESCLNVLDKERERTMIQIEQLLKEKIEISAIIDSISDIEKRLILDMRFLRGLTIKDVAKNLDYSLRHADRLINAAVDVIKVKNQDG